MSGIEIAGLILGALPIVISGIEHYAEGVATLGRFRRYQGELRMLINILSTEQMKLKNMCERLLLGVAPRDGIDAMTGDPFGPLWKNEAVQKKIRARLWDSYDSFERTLEDVHAAIQEMADRLGLDHDGTVKWLNGNALQRGLKRAGFSLMKRAYDDLLGRIKDGISSLEDLAQQNIVLEPERVKRSHSRLLKVVRETSQSIYHALKDSLVCHCTHDMGLHLSPHSVDFMPIDEDEQISSQLTFHVAISSSHVDEAGGNEAGPSSSTPLPVDMPATALWSEIVVKETTQHSATSSLGPPLSTAHSNGISTSAKRKKKVARVLTSMKRRATGTNSGNTLKQVQKVHATPPTSSSIPLTVAPQPSLCQTLRQVHRNRQLAQQHCHNTRARVQQLHHSSAQVYITDHEATGKSRGFGVSLLSDLNATNTTTNTTTETIRLTMPTTALGPSMPTVSLRQALETPSQGIPSLTYVDHLRLAVVIATGVSQLQRTPWLPQTLRTDDILFIWPATDGTGAPSYGRVFVAKRHMPDQQQSVDHGRNASATSSYPPSKRVLLLPRNQIVLSLGILLIELILGQSIPAPGPERPKAPDLLADHAAAQKLLDKVDEYAGPNYGSAVRFCLNPHMQGNSQGQEGDEDHQFQTGVVEPLERNLRIFQEL